MFNFDPKSSPYDKPAVEKSSDPSVRFTKKGKTEGHDVKFQKAKPNPNIPRPKSPPPISERKLEKNVKLNPKEKELPQIGHQKDAASKSPSPMSPQITPKQAEKAQAYIQMMGDGITGKCRINALYANRNDLDWKEGNHEFRVLSNNCADFMRKTLESAEVKGCDWKYTREPSFMTKIFSRMWNYATLKGYWKY